MSEYFKNFPIVEYCGLSLTNLLLKTSITKELLYNTNAFYDYTLRDGERPTTVAFDYYGSVNYAWLVLLSNEILDPYFDWVLDDVEFNAFIIKKYGSESQAKSIIVEYQYFDAAGKPGIIISPDTYTYFYNSSVAVGTFVAIYAYDKEVEKNESRRKIKLIDRNYAGKISLELNKKMNNAK